VIEEQGRELARLQQERFEMAGRLGYYQAEVEHLRGELKALQAPQEPIAPLPADAEPPHRPWWRFW
jgi:hypothetical protein